MGDEQQGGVLLGDEFGEKAQHPSLHGDIEGRRRLVGDEQRRAARHGDGDPDALTLPARQLVRVGPHGPRRIGEPNAFAQAHGCVGRVDLRQTAVTAQRFGDLLADAHQWIEGGLRVLEHHGDLLAAQLGQVTVAPPEELPTVESHGSADPRRSPGPAR